MAEPPPGEHMFVLDPPRRGIKAWSPWACICGAGGTGADDAQAVMQYELHLAGLWPAFIEPHGEYTQCHVIDGKVMWCKP
jgi:hypothetical protein